MLRSFLLLTVLFFSNLFGVESLEVASSSKVEILEQPSYILEDITLDQVYEKYQSGELQRLSEKTKSFGFSKKTLWIAFKLRNLDSNKQLISFRYAPLENIELYLYKNNKLIGNYKNGLLTPMDQREFKSINASFYLDHSFEPITYIAKINSSTPLLPEMFIGDESESLYIQIPKTVIFLIFIGGILLLFIYNSFLYFSTKEIDYGLFSAYLLALGVWVSSYNGYIIPFLDLNNNLIINLNHIMLFITFILLLMFSIKFLNLEKFSPKAYRFAKLVAVVSVVLFLLNSLVGGDDQLLTSLIIYGLFLLSLFIGFLSFFNNYPPAKLYLLALLGYIIGIYITYSMKYGLIFFSFFAFKAHILGTIWAVTLLSLALGYKIRLLHQEKNEALLKAETQDKMLFLQSRYASIGELVGNITHQWREPLAEIGAIQTNLQANLMIKGDIEKEKLSNSLEKTNNILQYLSETVNIFYGFFKNKKNDVDIININNEILNIKHMTHYVCKVENISFSYESNEIVKAFGNKSEFFNAVLNIILNAKDILVERKTVNPSIWIKSYTQNDNVVITIEDNAGGITQKPIEKIFQSGVSSKSDSIGIGLFIAKTLIEKRLFGVLDVENSEKGAKFTIKFPINPISINEEDEFINYDMEESTLKRINRLEKEVARQEEIEKTINQWEEIFNQTYWGVALHKGKSNRFEMVNPAFLNMYGYSEDEIKEISVPEIFASDSLDILPQVQKEAFEKGFASFEAVHKRKDNSTFPVTIDLTVIKDEKGGILYRIANIRDISKRKKSQEDLLLKEFALNTIYEAVYLIDEHGQFNYINESVCNSLGYSKDELLNMSIFDIAPYFTDELWKEHWEELKRDKSVVVTTKNRTKDGRLIPVEASANYFEYQGKGYDLAIVRDISERLEVEKRKEDEKMRLFFERQLVGMAITSPEKRWIHVNDKLCEIFGYSFDELQDKTWRDLVHPDDVDMEHFDKMIKGEIDDYMMEKRFIRKDGNIVYTILSVSCVRDDKGSVDYVLALFEDITERKHMLDTLHESEEKFRTLVENAEDHIVRYDKDARIIYMNPKIEKTLNIPISQMMGKTPSEVDEKGFGKFEEVLKGVIKTGKSVVHEQSIPQPNGETVYHHIKMIAEKDIEGNIIGGMVIGRDITESKKMIDALHKSEKLYRDSSNLLYSVMESSSEVVVFALDTHYNYLSLNKTHHEFYKAKWGIDVAVGKNFLELIPDEEFRATAKSALDATLEGESLTIVTEEALTIDGKEKIEYWENYLSPIFNNKEVEGITVFSINITKRKEIEKELKSLNTTLEQKVNDRTVDLTNKEREFRTLAENMPDFLIRYDKDGNRTYANHNFYQYFDLDPNEFLGTSPKNNPIAGVSSLVSQSVQHVLETSETIQVEIDFIQKDGQKRWGLIRYAPEFDDDGNISGIISVGHDITEVKNTQKELNLLGIAINNANDAVYIIKDDRSFYYVSDVASKMLGYTIKEFLDMKIEDIDPYMDTAQIDVAIDKTELGKVMIFPTKHRTKDGRVFDVEITSSRFEYEGEKLILSVAKDISQRKEHEEKIKELNETLEQKVKDRTDELQKALSFNESIINAIPDLLFEIDKEGNYIGIWARDEKLLADQKELLLGKNIKEILPPNVQKIAFETFKEVDKKGVSVGNSYKLDLPDGEHWFELSVTKKEPEGTYLALSREITDRKKSQLELEELNELLEEKVNERTLELQKALEFSEDIINTLPDLLFEIDIKGNYLNIWAQNKELLADQKEILLGNNIYNILSQKAADTVIESLVEADKKSYSTGKTIIIEIDAVKKEFELSVSKKFDGNFLILSRDITQR